MVIPPGTSSETQRPWWQTAVSWGQTVAGRWVCATLHWRNETAHEHFQRRTRHWVTDDVDRLDNAKWDHTSREKRDFIDVSVWVWLYGVNRPHTTHITNFTNQLTTCIWTAQLTKHETWHQTCVCVCLIDVDECAVGSHTCDVKAECYNAVGSFKCVCTEGFSGTGHRCLGQCVKV